MDRRAEGLVTVPRNNLLDNFPHIDRSNEASIAEGVRISVCQPCGNCENVAIEVSEDVISVEGLMAGYERWKGRFVVDCPLGKICGANSLVADNRRAAGLRFEQLISEQGDRLRKIKKKEGDKPFEPFSRRHFTTSNRNSLRYHKEEKGDIMPNIDSSEDN